MGATTAGVLAKAMTLLLLGVGVGAAHSVMEPVTLRMAETETTNITLPPPQDEAPEQEPTDPGDEQGAEPDAGTGSAQAPEPAAAMEPPPDPQTLVLEPYLSLDTTRRLWEAGAAELVDARHLEEFALGHIPRAHLYDPRTMYTGTPEWIDYFDPATTIIVVYCDGGECDASQNAVRQLQQMGFARAHIFRDGFPAWRDAGLPVNVGEPGASAPAQPGGGS